MTNDQFSAQLRQHLLGTADERVVQGQLASILDRVEVTPQRPTLVARLPWITHGLGFPPASQLRWALLIALALIAVVIAGVIAVGGPGPRITADDEGVAPTPEVTPSSPGCLPFLTEIDDSSTYTADTRSLSLRVTVPATARAPWLMQPDHFRLIKGACSDRTGPGGIEAGEVSEVDARACAISAGAVTTPAEAIAAVSAAQGIDVVSQTDVTLGGYAGTLFDFRVHDGLNACPNGQLMLVDGVTPFSPIVGSRLYLLDVDGTTLAIGLYGYELWGPDMRATVDQILASLQIETSSPAESPTPSDPPSGGIRNCAPAETLLEDFGTYTAPAGSMSVTVDVPGTREDPWLGLGSKFNLRSLKLACTDFGRSGGWIEASEVTAVETEACAGPGAAVDTFDEAVSAVSTAKGVNVDGQTDVTLGGHPGIRLDVRLDIDPNACADEQIPLLNGMTRFDPGARYPLYLIDVDGKTLAIALYQTDIWRPEVRAHVNDILASLEIETTAPNDPANADCMEFRGPSRYTAPAGSLSIEVSVPGSASEPWMGSRSTFSLLRAACESSQGTGFIQAGEVTRIETNVCEGGSVAVDTPEEAIAAVGNAAGVDVISQTEVTLGGYPGTRFELAVADAANACLSGQLQLVDGVNPFDLGLRVTLYLVDVNGKTLAVALYGPPDWSPDVTDTVDIIIGSMQIEP